MTTTELQECFGCRKDTAKIKQCKRCRGTGNEPKAIAVEVWACLCGNYFASSRAGDLAASFNTKMNSSERSHARARCPDCGGERVACPAIVLVPIYNESE